MKIIALQGKSNVGKTTTLKQMILTILNNNLFQLNDNYDRQTIIEGCCKPKGDVQCVFENNGIKIGITTRGDTKECLEEDFSKHFTNCDMVVCAVHTSGGTVNFIKGKGSDGVIIHTKWFVEPQTGTRKDEVNVVQSNYLIKEVQDLIKGIKRK